MSQLNQPTSDLARVRQGYMFMWGLLVEIHVIGRYSVVEFRGHHEDSEGRWTLDGRFETEHSFMGYTGDQCTNTSKRTLEEALLDAMAIGSGKTTARAEAAAVLLGFG